MNRNRSTPSACREDVLAMLSEDEVRALAAGKAHCFAKGDEYLDLSRLDEGVRTARGSGPPFTGLLPRAAVHESTWQKVLSYLATSRSR